MDVSQIDSNFVELLDSCYISAENVFGVEPICAAPKKQRKIRKWITKTYLNGVDFPKKVAAYLDSGKEDPEFFAFLKACHERVQKEGTWRKQRFDRFASAFSDEVRSALWHVTEPSVYVDRFIRRDHDKLALVIDECSSFRRTLVLHGVTDFPPDDGRILLFEEGSLIREGDLYTLVGSLDDPDECTCVPYAVRFRDASVEVEIFRATAAHFQFRPWDHLSLLAQAILDKKALSGNHWNARELEMLPLLEELAALYGTPSAYQKSAFPLLKAEMKALGYHALVSKMEKAEQHNAGAGKKKQTAVVPAAELNDRKYEPLWRTLYNRVSATQEGYPTRVDKFCPPDILQNTRTDIQRFMESNGYAGTYPDFVKTGPMKGIHLAESYNMSYWVGMEKQAVYRVHCNEEFWDGRLTLEFLSGTELPRKDAPAEDIYSCTFNAKGKRFFETVRYEVLTEPGQEPVIAPGMTLEDALTVAVKRAELRKLTKQEKQAFAANIPLLPLFLAFFLIGGGLFAVFMTLGMVLVSCIATLILGDYTMIPGMLSEMPWWQLFALSWVGFGGAMGIVTVLAKNK